MLVLYNYLFLYDLIDLMLIEAVGAIVHRIMTKIEFYTQYLQS